MPQEATHSTIELSHGGRVHVALPPSEVQALVDEARRRRRTVTARGDSRVANTRDADPATFVSLERIKNDPDIERSARSWRSFSVDAFAVIGIFPMDQGSLPSEKHTP